MLGGKGQGELKMNAMVDRKKNVSCFIMILAIRVFFLNIKENFPVWTYRYKNLNHHCTSSVFSTHFCWVWCLNLYTCELLLGCGTWRNLLHYFHSCHCENFKSHTLSLYRVQLEAVGASKMLVPMHQSTLHHTVEKSNPHGQCHDKLKSH
jgi:hypothetical protein